MKTNRFTSKAASQTWVHRGKAQERELHVAGERSKEVQRERREPRKDGPRKTGHE